MFSIMVHRGSARGERHGRKGNNLRDSCIDSGVSTPVIEESHEATEPQMTALDRCDACGAQAYVRVELPYGVLMFCGHHANAHLEKLSASALSVYDERERIH